MLIYKILRTDEWAELREFGETAGAPVDISDGFVHFSTASQVAETAAKHFAGIDGLVLLAMEADRLGSALRWETSRGGALFPHLYAPLRIKDIRWHCALPLVGGVHKFPAEMGWKDSFTDPDRVQFEAFKNLDRNAPVEMLNLVRFRARASYPKGHKLEGSTGAEAYAEYGRRTAPVLDRVGGYILWRGQFEATLIGPVNEVWDAMFIAQYPSAHAFLAMITDEEYRQAVKHRQAGVATSRLIRCASAELGDGFFG